MRFAFVDAEKANDPIEMLCRVLDVSRSGYDAWSEQPLGPARPRPGEASGYPGTVLDAEQTLVMFRAERRNMAPGRRDEA